jgi:hypothetical protein
MLKRFFKKEQNKVASIKTQITFAAPIEKGCTSK